MAGHKGVARLHTDGIWVNIVKRIQNAVFYLLEFPPVRISSAHFKLWRLISSQGGRPQIPYGCSTDGVQTRKAKFKVFNLPILLYTIVTFFNSFKINPNLQQCCGQRGACKERSADGSLPEHSPLQRAHHQHNHAPAWPGLARQISSTKVFRISQSFIFTLWYC